MAGQQGPQLAGSSRVEGSSQPLGPMARRSGSASWPNTEIQFLRSLSDLQGAWQHRVTLHGRAAPRAREGSLHADFAGGAASAPPRNSKQALGRSGADPQPNTKPSSMPNCDCFARRPLFEERRGGMAAERPGSAGSLAQLDWLKFAEKFRGPEEYVKQPPADCMSERFAGASERARHRLRTRRIAGGVS